MTIRFYRTSETPYGAFSNFADYKLKIKGIEYLTSEHFFQSYKFITTDQDHAERIRKVKLPMDAANLGRDKSYPLRSDWNDVKDDVMRIAVCTKFCQHRELGDLLISTGKEEIIEATDYDYYWGEGTKKTGKNMLGKILMELRPVVKAYHEFENGWDDRFAQARSRIEENNLSMEYNQKIRHSSMGQYLKSAWNIVDQEFSKLL